MTTMGGAATGLSRRNEGQALHKACVNCILTHLRPTSKATSSPSRHEVEAHKQRNSWSRRPDIHRSVTPCALNRHHLPGPPPRHTTALPRAATPHDPVACSPRRTRQPSADHGRRTASGAAAPTYPPTVPDGTRRPGRLPCCPRSSRSPPKPCRTGALPHGATVAPLPEAAASTHKNHPGAAAPAYTTRDDKRAPHNKQELALQSNASKEVMTQTPPLPTPAKPEFGFSPGEPSTT